MRKVLIASLMFISILILTSCSSHTITDNPENYIYKLNDSINIYDNSDTRDLFGVLKITSVNVLSETPFVLKEADGYDANSKPVYKDVTYNQIVQVNYTYEIKNSGKTISADNFYVTDSNSKVGLKNPNTEFNPIKTENTTYFVIALQTKSSSINIGFNYGVLQLTTTAKIQADISPITNDPEKSDSINSSKDSDESRNTSVTSSKNTNTTSFSDTSVISSSNISGVIKTTFLIALILILLIIIMLLIVVIIIISNKQKTNYW